VFKELLQDSMDLVNHLTGAFLLIYKDPFHRSLEFLSKTFIRPLVALNKRSFVILYICIIPTKLSRLRT